MRDTGVGEAMACICSSVGCGPKPKNSRAKALPECLNTL